MKFHPLQALISPAPRTLLLFGHNSPTSLCASLVPDFHTKRFILTSEGRYRNKFHNCQNIGFSLTVVFVSYLNQELTSRLQDTQILMLSFYSIHKSLKWPKNTIS